MGEPGALRFGIIGCGSASIPVGEAMTTSPWTELVAVYDVNSDLAEDLGARFEARKAETLEALLSDPTVDAVYIAVPHYLLAPLTRRVLEAGKHALTEKPLAISLKEADELIVLSKERQLALGVFYEMRYAAANDKAQELIRSGAIGTVTAIQIQTLIDKKLSYWQSGYMGRSVNPWRGIKAQAGGGVVLMNTSHLLDAITYMTGLHITDISAEIGSLVADVEVEDTAAATFRFDNGAIGSLLSGAHIAGANDDEYCSIYGAEGQIRLPDPYGTDPLRFYLKRDWNEFEGGQWHTIPGDPVAVYQRAVEEFAQAVQSGGCVPSDAENARYVLSVVLGIYESAKQKKTISIS
jgi:predicted dehydrogenase